MIEQFIDEGELNQTKEFMRRMWQGELRGALGYIVPNQDWRRFKEKSPRDIDSDDFPEKFLDWALGMIRCRSYGRDHSVPVIAPVFGYGGGVLSTAIGANYEPEIDHTNPLVESMDEIDRLNMNPTLQDGLLPNSLDLIRYVVEQTGGSIPIQYHLTGGPMTIASLAVRDTLSLIHI